MRLGSCDRYRKIVVKRERHIVERGEKMLSEKMLSEKMVEYRAKHNLTQKQLAELCGITAQTVVKAEQGKPLTRLTEKKIELAIKE